MDADISGQIPSPDVWLICFFVLMPCQLFQLSEGRENLEFYFSKYNGFCVRKKTKEEEEKDKKRKRKKDRIFRVPVPLHQCFG